MSRRQSFTEKRRARLRKAVDRLERLEPRSMIVEPIPLTGLAITAVQGLARLGIVDVHGGGEALRLLQAAGEAARQRGNRVASAAVLPLPHAIDFVPITVGGAGTAPAGTASAAYKPEAPASVSASDPAGDWLNLKPAPSQSTETGISIPWQPAKPPAGGPTQPPRGSLNVPQANSGRGAITPLRVPAPQSSSSNSAGGAATLLAAAANAANSAGSKGYSKGNIASSDRRIHNRGAQRRTFVLVGIFPNASNGESVLRRMGWASVPRAGRGRACVGSRLRLGRRFGSSPEQCRVANCGSNGSTPRSPMSS